MNALDSPIAQLYVLIEWTIRLAALFIVPLRRPPTAATAWLLLLFFLPIVGLVMYLLVGRPRLSRDRAEKIAHLAQTLRPITERLSRAEPQGSGNLPARFAAVDQMVRRWRQFPLFDGNRIGLIDSMDAFAAALVDGIDRATDHVHLTFYIAAVDRATAPVFDALERAAARGVVVRLIVDDFGSKETMRGLRRLARRGIAVGRAFPRSKLPRKSARFDLRNHRKLVVIDGQVGYAGSMNLVHPEFRRGQCYEDLMLRIEGPVVLELQAIFAGDWYLETGLLLDTERYFPTPVTAGHESCVGLPSGPEYPEPLLQRLLLGLLHAATERVEIVTPYFVPDESTLDALKAAARRGVHCELILPESLDHPLVQLAQESYFDELLEAGVTIRRHPARLLHSKVTLCDGRISLVGSANLDVRSSLINAEFGLLCYSSETAARLADQIERYRRDCPRLSPEDWQARGRGRILAQNLARLTSPLL
ncbi:cardiolipin synthase [Guyparkeria hydrothermalis]|uniref:cardiolipin synthase n=1 Tax=Guyparkeria hydrothermalis TaxID=923 RepID=UPI00202228EA|nr:cardiolipin synthase [Guyparkeria hydrothermalis]MCL7751081.1 cardiolipin synthase [Guyparkeria hydrothermalis]